MKILIAQERSLWCNCHCGLKIIGFYFASIFSTHGCMFVHAKNNFDSACAYYVSYWSCRL